MGHSDLAVVTGAFGYTGGYVARRLLDQGVRVRTLTRRTDRLEASRSAMEVAPLDFSDPGGLRRSMEGAGVLYNTYWIRYARGEMTFDRAVENTGTLFEAAIAAGVGRIVHFSVTNPSHDSELPHFRGKAQAEEMLENLGVPLRHHQIDPGVRHGRAADQQHGLGAAPLPGLPCPWKRRLTGAAGLCRRRCCSGGLGGFPEWKLRHRRGGATDFVLQGANSPASLRDGRPRTVRAHVPVSGPRPDPARRSDYAGRSSYPRRGGWPDGWPAAIEVAADRHDPGGRLAPRQRGQPGGNLRVRVTAELGPSRTLRRRLHDPRCSAALQESFWLPLQK